MSLGITMLDLWPLESTNSVQELLLCLGLQKVKNGGVKEWK